MNVRWLVRKWTDRVQFFILIISAATLVQAAPIKNARIELFETNHPADPVGFSKPKIISLYGGFSYGPESPLLGFPALEVRFRPLREFRFLSTLYIGGKASAWYFIARVGNVGLETGFQYKKAIFDASLTYSALASWETTTHVVGPAKKLTFNPKIGFSHSIVSLKIGPSFKLREYLRDSDREENNKRPGLLNYFLDDGGLTAINVEVGIGFHLF